MKRKEKEALRKEIGVLQGKVDEVKESVDSQTRAIKRQIEEQRKIIANADAELEMDTRISGCAARFVLRSNRQSTINRRARIDLCWYKLEER